MIARRLADSLRSQDWTAIAIEFVLLVLGVFLGIQVSNWNAERLERIRAGQLLDGFRADMRDYMGVTRKFDRRALAGLAAFDAARARGLRPAPYFMRLRGSDKPPTSVWEVAQQSGLTDMVHPSLMFEIGYFYSELDGIGEKFVRYSKFVEAEILPRLDRPEQFYDAAGNLRPEFRENMERLRDWAMDSQVTEVTAACLIKRFDAPMAAGPSCRVDYGDYVGKEDEP